MRVAAFVHFYVPFRCAGSETMLHTLLKSLRHAGHEVQAFSTNTPDAPYVYEYEDIRVTSANWLLARQRMTEFIPDVVITHHQNTTLVVPWCKSHGIPSVFLMHNNFEQNRSYLDLNPDLIVFNTDWIRRATEYPGDSIVVHPPVFPEEHATTPGECVTLVNLSENKGAVVFYRLAELMPDTRFLGVIGGHGKQIVRRLPNVEIVEHTDDMPGRVWSRTKILLMPSLYESYGMAGVEALASGIPVIANPTPGLVESLGPAGIFVDREDTPGYQSAIRWLSEPGCYSAASALARNRSRALDPSTELKQWVSTIERLTR